MIVVVQQKKMHKFCFKLFRQCFHKIFDSFFCSIVAGTEPLNKDGSPPHHEAQTVKLEMEDKMA